MKNKKNLPSAEVALFKSSFFVNLKRKALLETTISFLVVSFVPLILAHDNQNQLLVGTIVNATLFLTVLRVGLVNAIFISFIPSFIALSRGMLPPQTVGLLPFIALSNSLMVTTFFFLKKNLYLKVLASASVKTISMIFPILIGVKISSGVAFMISWPQLLTSLLGGMVAIAINSFLKKKRI